MEKIKVVEPIRSKADIKRIITYFDKSDNHKYAVIFTLGINSGLRVSDILSLDVGDVLNQSDVTLREKKTGKYKKFPLKPSLQSLLNEYCKDRELDEPLFVGWRTQRLDRSQVYRMINRACKELGIRANVGTHTMRKTFGYHHYKQFHDIALLQTIFNHSSPEVTKRYIGITQDEVNNSYMSLNLTTSAKSRYCRNITEEDTSMERIIKFLKNYINHGGIRHRDFALDLLEVVGA